MIMVERPELVKTVNLWGMTYYYNYHSMAFSGYKLLFVSYQETLDSIMK